MNRRLRGPFPKERDLHHLPSAWVALMHAGV
ncbi:hypothetical protein HNR07_001671 [Nocardiopsis metallicus]|uniref:Uncharacterized protein n=1 Tax=Nocardiopsis metallicus TaxID=179819 RepID=A0A840W3I1_9ACTN|nr:hypothetical protein [Nocardiopsis metallicus]